MLSNGCDLVVSKKRDGQRVVRWSYKTAGFVEAGPPRLIWFLPTLGFRVGAGLVHIHGGRYSHL